MQRLSRQTERGAIAVVVALLMVPLIGFAALAIDVASMWSQQQRLQVAADASALAIAQDCARHNCGTPAMTASSLTTANFGPGASASILTPSLAPSTGQVTVRASTVARHLFAPVLGINSTTVGAQSTASWGYPSGGVSMLPIAFSWCEFVAQTGGGVPSQTTQRIIWSTKGSTTTCTGPSNLVVPGGFGWVDPPSGGCTVVSSIAQILTSSTGNQKPSSCSDAAFQAVLNTIVLIPVFNQYAGSGNNAQYWVYGYAAFKLTGYRYPGVEVNASECGSNNCVKGYFTQFVDLDNVADFSATAPDLGSAIVKLTS